MNEDEREAPVWPVGLTYKPKNQKIIAQGDMEYAVVSGMGNEIVALTSRLDSALAVKKASPDGPLKFRIVRTKTNEEM